MDTIKKKIQSENNNNDILKWDLMLKWGEGNPEELHNDTMLI